MRSSGNGNPTVCANNLLSMVRGECPMERTKGLDPSLIGSPLPDAVARLQQDARWLIGVYEPRVDVKEISVTPGSSPGDIRVTAKLTEKEG